MPAFKRILFILTVVIGTPVVCQAIGYFIGGTRSDPSNLAAAFGFVIGVIAMFISLVLGVVVSIFVQDKRWYYSLAGYYVPSVLIYVAVLSIRG